MGRKRSRRDNSSEDNDTDSEVDVDFTEKSAGTKKYSLRERKSRRLQPQDFKYYEDDDDDDSEKHLSDADDYEEGENDNIGAMSSTYYEQETTTADSFSNPDGLIDFEDMIRADIVVNRNSIDYDNLIQKTEIKLTESSQQKRRREKLKRQSEKFTKKETANTIESDESQGTLIQKLQPEVNICEGETEEKTVISKCISKSSNKDFENVVATKDKSILASEKAEDNDDVIVLKTKQDVMELGD